MGVGLDNRPGAKDLKGRSVRSASLTMGAQLAEALLQTASAIVLARLLAPHDYGVVAMVASVTAFARLFQDLGLSSATIQTRELTHEQASTLFWINVTVGAALTLTIAAGSPLVAWFYQEPEVLWVTVLAALNFIIGSFGIQHAALLKRSMRFKAVTTTQVLSTVLGVTTSVTCAVLGLRYWSLVFGSLLVTASSTAMLWMLSGWIPGRLNRDSGVRRLLHFGAHVTGFELANYFARNLDNLLIGRVWGTSALGLYSRAYSLLMLPINNLRQPLSAVALPALSGLVTMPERYRRYYRQYLSILAVTSMPLVAFLFVCSDEVILLLLGPRWAESSSIFGILAFSAFVQPVASTRGLVLMSTGHGARYLQWGIANAIATAIAFSVGIAWGAHGVAIGYAVVNYALLIPSLAFCFKGTPIRVRDFFDGTARAAIASLAAGAVTVVFRSSILATDHSIRLLLSSGVVFAASVCLAFVVIPGGIAQLQQYIALRRYLIPSSRPDETVVASAG